MTTRQQRRAAERKAAKNGATETRMLTEAQVAQLQQMMQPLVQQWKLSQALAAVFLQGAGISNSQFSIDINTGIVSLVGSAVPPPDSLPEVNTPKENG